MQKLSVAVLAGVAGLVLAMPYLVSAQSAGDAPAAEQRRAPLPNNFGRIAVSDQQREALYAVQDEYAARIAELQRQVRTLVQERDTKMEAVLTPGQKLRLAELREEARQRAARRTESGRTPAASEPEGDAPAKP